MRASDWDHTQQQFEQAEQDGFFAEQLVAEGVADFLAKHDQAPNIEALLWRCWDGLKACPYNAEWHALRVALAARGMASRLGEVLNENGPDPGDMFVAGLLHDAGKLNNAIPTEGTVKQSDTHKITSGVMLRRAGFPDLVVQAVMRHELSDLHELFNDPPEQPELFWARLILILSDTLTARSHSAVGGRSNGQLWRNLAEIRRMLEGADGIKWVNSADREAWIGLMFDLVNDLEIPLC